MADVEVAAIPSTTSAITVIAAAVLPTTAVKARTKNNSGRAKQQTTAAITEAEATAVPSTA